MKEDKHLFWYGNGCESDTSTARARSATRCAVSELFHLQPGGTASGKQEDPHRRRFGAEVRALRRPVSASTTDRLNKKIGTTRFCGPRLLPRLGGKPGSSPKLFRLLQATGSTPPIAQYPGHLQRRERTRTTAAQICCSRSWMIRERSEVMRGSSPTGASRSIFISGYIARICANCSGTSVAR